MNTIASRSVRKKWASARSTVARVYGIAREKLADALVNGKALHIDGGDVIVCSQNAAGMQGCFKLLPQD